MELQQLIRKLTNFRKEPRMAEQFDIISKIESREDICDATLRQSGVEAIELIRAYERRAIYAEKQVKRLLAERAEFLRGPVTYKPELEILINQIRDLYKRQEALYENKVNELKADIEALYISLRTLQNRR